MEGDKTTGEKWFTEKVTEKQVWNRYVHSCDRAQQPTVGSSKLLHNVWRSPEDIVTVKPTGHAICSTCSDIHSARLALEGLDGAAEIKELRAALDAEMEAHEAFHSKEIFYYDDAMAAATYRPHTTTCLTIDAPTQHQGSVTLQGNLMALIDGSQSLRLFLTLAWV